MNTTSTEFSIVFEQNGKFGVKDINGNILVPADYQEIAATYKEEHFARELPVPAKRNGHYGLVAPDTAGTWVTPFIYDDISVLNTLSQYGVKIGDKWGVINSKGVMLIPPIMDHISDECNGTRYFDSNGKEGFIYEMDYVPPIFDDLEPDCNSATKARIGDKYGWITEDLKLTDNEDDAFYGEWTY